MTVGKRLRAIRKTRNLTLSELGEGTGLSVSFLSEIERDVSCPSLGTLRCLAAYYNVEAGSLISTHAKLLTHFPENSPRPTSNASEKWNPKAQTVL